MLPSVPSIPQPPAETEKLQKHLQDEIIRRRLRVSDREVRELYAVAPLVYAATEFWANNVAAVPFYLYNGEQLIEDRNHEINQLLRSRSFSRYLMNTERTLRFYGWSAAIKARNPYGYVKRLDWLNPNSFTRNLDLYGNLTSIALTMPERGEQRLYPMDEVVYTHLFDFDDDNDGVSSAEAVFLSAFADTEMSATLYSLFQNMALPMAILQPTADMYTNNLRVDAKTEKDSLRDQLRGFFRGVRNYGRTLTSAFRWESVPMSIPFRELMMAEQYEPVRLNVSIGFNVNLEFFIPGTTTYAELQGKLQLWYRNWLTPRAKWYGEELSEQLCARYPGLEIRPDMSGIVIEDEAKLLDATTKRVASTLITLGEARTEQGYEDEPALRDLFVIGGVPVHRDDLRDYWRMQSGLMLPTGGGDDPLDPVPPIVDAAQAAAPADDAATASSVPVFVGLSLKNNVELIDLQSRLKTLFPNAAVKWNAPDQFHITLLYAPAVDVALANAFVDAAAGLLARVDVSEWTLRVGSLRTFDTLGDHALHFAIRRDEALLALQTQLYELAVSHDIPLSGYSQPAAYKPHVTMAYLPERISAVTFNGKREVSPDSVYICVDEQDVYRSAALEGEAAKEIEIAVRKAAKKIAFVSARLSPHTLDYIAALVEIDTLARPAAVQAAKRYELGIRAAKALNETRRQFEDALLTLMRQAHHEKLPKSVFVSRMLTNIYRHASNAYADAYSDVGIEIDWNNRALWDDPEVQARERYIAQWTDSQAQYVRNVADKLYADGVISLEEIENRKPQMWFAGSIYPVYAEALTTARSNIRLKWRWRAEAEHCRSCRNLNGQVRTARYWASIGIAPKSRRLDCWLGCKCEFEVTGDAVTEGQLPRYQFKNRKDHHDDDDKVPAFTGEPCLCGAADDGERCLGDCEVPRDEAASADPARGA